MKDIINEKKRASILGSSTNHADVVVLAWKLDGKVTGKKINLKEFSVLGDWSELLKSFYKEKYQASSLRNELSEEKYLGLIDADVHLNEMKQLTIRFDAWKDTVFSFHPKNDDYYIWLQINHPKIYEKQNPEMVHFKIGDMIEYGDSGYKINNSKSYYTTTLNKKQLDFIAAIEGVIETFKTRFNVLEVKSALYGTPLENSTAYTLKKLMRPYVKHVSQDLSKIEYNYYEIIFNIS